MLVASEPSLVLYNFTELKPTLSEAVPFISILPFTTDAAGFAIFTVGASLSIANSRLLTVSFPALSFTVTLNFVVFDVI